MREPRRDRRHRARVLGAWAYVTWLPCVVIAPTRLQIGLPSRTPTVTRMRSDLVAGLQERSADFEISVAAYPEVHPEASDAAIADLENLKRKLDAGATRAITQFFFDADRVPALSATCCASSRDRRSPIIPGILPITRFPQLQNASLTACGASVPDWLARMRFAGLEEDDAETRQTDRRKRSPSISGEAARAPRASRTFHFYTLNRSELDVRHLSCARGARDGRSRLRTPPEKIMSTGKKESDASVCCASEQRILAPRRCHGHDDPGGTALT